MIKPRSPTCLITKPSKPNEATAEAQEKKEEKQTARIDEIKRKWEDRKIAFSNDLREAYFNVNDKHKRYFKYKKVLS